MDQITRAGEAFILPMLQIDWPSREPPPCASSASSAASSAYPSAYPSASSLLHARILTKRLIPIPVACPFSLLSSPPLRQCSQHFFFFYQKKKKMSFPALFLFWVATPQRRLSQLDTHTRRFHCDDFNLLIRI